MPGFRVRLPDLPEQPGERRISVHWFFIPVGLGFLAAGAAGVRDSLLNGRPSSKDWGMACAVLGLFELLAFVLCQKAIRQGKPPQSLFTIRVRQLILFVSMAAYMALTFTVFQLLPGQLAWAMPFFWVLGAGFVWNGIVHYFRKHPPKQ